MKPSIQLHNRAFGLTLTIVEASLFQNHFSRAYVIKVANMYEYFHMPVLCKSTIFFLGLNGFKSQTFQT